MRVEIAAAITFPAAEAPKAMLRELRTRLSVPNPKHLAAKRVGRLAWGAPERLRYVEARSGFVRVPRGAMPIVREEASRAGVRLELVDRRVFPLQSLGCRSPSLRDYQAAAVQELARRHQGVFILPAGAGKTRSALGAVAALDTPTLVLVGSLDLAEQWRTEIGAQLGVEAGLVGGGANRVELVTVATVQTLTRWENERLDAFLAGSGLLIVDEAHHVPASQFSSIVHRSPSKYRLALTATPTREDGLGPVLEWFVGPVLATMSHAELIEAGNLVAPEYRPVETRFSFDYRGPDDWQPLLDALWRDEARNRLIVDVTATEARAGHSVLVLTGRVDHAKMLAEALISRGVVAAALTGDMRKRDRSDALDSARAGRTSVLVATSLADEGLDIPRLSRVVLAFPAKAAGRIEQRIGRIMRPHGDKGGAAIFDVVDARVGVLRYQAGQRRAVFERITAPALMAHGRG